MTDNPNSQFRIPNFDKINLDNIDDVSFSNMLAEAVLSVSVFIPPRPHNRLIPSSLALQVLQNFHLSSPDLVEFLQILKESNT
jgi:hypothetical protein